MESTSLVASILSGQYSPVDFPASAPMHRDEQEQLNLQCPKKGVGRLEDGLHRGLILNNIL